MSETGLTTKTQVHTIMQKAAKPGTFKGLKSSDVATILSQYAPQLAQALPKHISAERMIQMSASLIASNPKIAECDFGSVIGAVMQASILDFKPVQALGLCWLVPYAGRVQFQIG